MLKILQARVLEQGAIALDIDKYTYGTKRKDQNESIL